MTTSAQPQRFVHVPDTVSQQAQAFLRTLKDPAPGLSCSLMQLVFACFPSMPRSPSWRARKSARSC